MIGGIAWFAFNPRTTITYPPPTANIVPGHAAHFNGFHALGIANIAIYCFSNAHSG
jgi:hypothetical protein